VTHIYTKILRSLERELKYVEAKEKFLIKAVENSKCRKCEARRLAKCAIKRAGLIQKIQKIQNTK